MCNTMGRTGRPDSLRHRRLRMTGTEPHAPRGTAGRGPNWDRGPGAGHAGAARRCTKRHRRLWAQPGPSAVYGPRELRVDACSSRHRRPRDHSWDRGPYAGRRSCSTRSGKLRVVACTPRHRRARDYSWDRGLRVGRRSCATRSGPTRLRMPTLAPPAAGVGGTRKGAAGCGRAGGAV